MIEVKEGDIVIAPFRYAESEERKIRPCFVAEVTSLSVLLCCISSQKIAAGYPTEVALSVEEAQAIGLVKPSRIDFGKRDRCIPHDVRKKIGRITQLPVKKLRECAKAAEVAGLLKP